MPFCPNCGKETGKGITFCPECGQRIKEEFTPEERQKYIEELKASMDEKKRAEKELKEKQKGEEEERKEQEAEARKRQAEKWTKKHPWVAVIILLVIIGAFTGFFWDIMFGGSSSEPATETYTSTQEFIEISAGQLCQEYKSNEIAADLKYKDRFLKVHGIVQNIGEDIMGDPYVAIVEDEDDWWGVQCMYPDTDAYRELLAKVNPGQEITVTGRCKGYFLMTVLLEHE